MYPIILYIFFIFSFQSVFSGNIPIVKRENLHEFMNDQELEYYFGPRSKRSEFNDYEIIDIPENLWSNHKNLALQIDAFGYPLDLKLRQNDKLFIANLKVLKKLSEDQEEFINNDNDEIKNCHYLHIDNESVAAISNCFKNEIVSFFFFKFILSLYKFSYI